MYLMEINYANEPVCILGGITGLLVMILTAFYVTFLRVEEVVSQKSCRSWVKFDSYSKMVC